MISKGEILVIDDFIDLEYQKAKINLFDRARNYAKNLGLYSGNRND